MTAKSNPNAQPRKQLSDQLDRLDGILDALSDGLNQAVRGAVEAAVGQSVERAVQGVLTKVLHNPAVRDVLRATRVADTGSRCGTRPVSGCVSPGGPAPPGCGVPGRWRCWPAPAWRPGRPTSGGPGWPRRPPPCAAGPWD